MTQSPPSFARRLLAALLVFAFAAGGAVAATRTSTAVLVEDEVLWCWPSEEDAGRELSGGAPLTPAFPGENLDVVVELALGADLTANPGTWVWTDISQYVRLADRIIISRGRGDEWTEAGPSQAALTLDNRDGRFTRLNPVGAYYPDLRRNTPLRIRVDLHTGAGPQTRFTGYVTRWAPRWDKGGNNRFTPITADGIFRRLGQGDPLHSAIYRSMIGVAEGDYRPHAYWPMEDGSGATQFASALPDRSAMTVTSGTVAFAATDTLAGSEALPQFESDGRVSVAVPSYVDTGQWVVQHMVFIPSSATGTDLTILSVHTASSNARTVTLRVNLSAKEFTIQVRDAAGTLTFNTPQPFNPPPGHPYDNLPGRWISVSLSSEDDVVGTDDFFTAAFLELDGEFFASWSEQVGADHHGILTLVGMNGALDPSPSGVADASYGHTVVFTDASFTVGIDDAEHAVAAGGHVGEQAHERVDRLCREEQIPVTITGTSSEAMGAQSTGTLLDNLRECEDADLGVLFETLDGGVGYRTITDRYNRDAALVLDYDEGQVQDPWAPDDDDQRLKNDITVTRPSGSFARDTDAAAISNEGRYRQPHTANIETDSQLADIAGWLKHLGTWDELRFPAVGFKLHRHAGLLASWLAFDLLTHRCDIVNLPVPVPASTEQAIEGYMEMIGSRDWDVTLNLAPNGPYTVAVLDDDDLGKLDSGSSTLTSGITASATSISVTTGDAADLWTTDTAEMPIPIVVGGEHVSVSAVTGSSSPQTFTVTRSINGVEKTHAAGDEVHVLNPARLAL